jgi:hypothetical protein
MRTARADEQKGSEHHRSEGATARWLDSRKQDHDGSQVSAVRRRVYAFLEAE